MRIVVDRPVKAGDATVAAIAGVEIDAFPSFGVAAVSGRKIPLAVVIWETDKAKVFPLNGQELPVAELEKLLQARPDTMTASAVSGMSS